MQPHKGAKIGFQPRIRKGAFFEAAWRYGCRNFSVYNRTYISSTFSNPVDEYWHVIEHVALWPVMGERQIEITGPDAERFVQLLTPRDMSKCSVNQCKYALLTAQDGGILCDPIIVRLAEDKFWISTSDCDMELWTKGVAVNAGMQVGIRDADISLIQVQGPKAPALMCDLLGEAILDLKYYWITRVPFEGTELVVSRTGWSGEFGYEICLADSDKGDTLFDALMAAGKPHNVAPGSVSQARRMESGILSWGVDMTPEENPFEVGLGRLVELPEGAEIIGRAALQALKTAPPKRRLVGLVLDGDPVEPNEEPWPVTRDRTRIGKLTSVVHSPRLKKNIALALVDSTYGSVGTEMSVETWTGLRTAWVTELPFMPKRQLDDPRALLRKNANTAR